MYSVGVFLDSHLKTSIQRNGFLGHVNEEYIVVFWKYLWDFLSREYFFSIVESWNYSVVLLGLLYILYVEYCYFFVN